MLLRKDPPSYGSQLEAGATSLTEAWDANPHNSQDHFMLGAADEWFYRGLAGLDIDFSREALAEQITIRPSIVTGVTSAKATYNSTRGMIVSSWWIEGPTLHLDVTIPPNTESTIVLPAPADSLIDESDAPAAAATGVTALPATSNNLASFHVGSGTYHFTSKLLPGL
jgi:hypothetical protein